MAIGFSFIEVWHHHSLVLFFTHFHKVCWTAAYCQQNGHQRVLASWPSWKICSPPSGPNEKPTKWNTSSFTAAQPAGLDQPTAETSRNVPFTMSRHQAPTIIYQLCHNMINLRFFTPLCPIPSYPSIFPVFRLGFLLPKASARRLCGLRAGASAAASFNSRLETWCYSCSNMFR